MVAPEQIDVIQSSIAAIVTPADHPVTVDQNSFLDFLSRPVNISQDTLGQLSVNSTRDGIEITLSGNKLNVRDLSGRQDMTESRLPTVSHRFLEAIGAGDPTAYGINYDLIVSMDDPATWAADNLISEQLRGRVEQSAVSAGLFVRWDAAPKTWNIRIEPSPRQDGIRIDFNAHQDTQRLPDSVELLAELTEQYDALVIFMNQIGL